MTAISIAPKSTTPKTTTTAEPTNTTPAADNKATAQPSSVDSYQTGSTQYQPTSHSDPAIESDTVLTEDLQKNLQQIHQGANTKATLASKVAVPPKTARSEAEIREMVQKKIMPGIHKALPKFGMDNNTASCDKAAALTKHALDKMGVRGARIVNGNQHTFVEVKTKEGKTLIIDPTIAQFVNDNNKVDKKLQKEGFVGTKEQLADLLYKNHDKLGNMKNDPAMQSAQLAEKVLGGEFGEIEDKARLSYQQDIKNARQKLVEQFHYPKGVSASPELTKNYATTARESVRWYQEGAMGPRTITKRKKLEDGTEQRTKVDMSEQFKQAFVTMEQQLGLD